MLMFIIVPFKTTVPHKYSFSSAKQRYLIRGTPWQVCRQPIRLRIYRKIQRDLYVYSKLTVELFGKAHRAGSDCRSGGTWGSVWKWRRHFHTRQNICALREQRQRFYCKTFMKSSLYAHSVSIAVRRTENNGRLRWLFLSERQTEVITVISSSYLIPLLFCVRNHLSKEWFWLLLS